MSHLSPDEDWFQVRQDLTDYLQGSNSPQRHQSRFKSPQTIHSRWS